VHNLVRAGMERRRIPGSGSAGSITPVSENGEITFSISSEDDSEGSRSGSGSFFGAPSLNSSRTSLHGAIGSDRPSSRQQNHPLEQELSDSNVTATNLNDESVSNVGSFAAVFKNGGRKLETREPERRKGPMLVLTSAAEKRKSSIN